MALKQCRYVGILKGDIFFQKNEIMEMNVNYRNDLHLTPFSLPNSSESNHRDDNGLKTFISVGKNCSMKRFIRRNKIPTILGE